LSVRVPAKINLHLEVIGRRPDGFHEVRTLLQSIDLFDELSAEDAPGGRLELVVDPPGSAPADESNLVLRAARALQREAEDPPGARIVLTKRIPAGSGLGGGSADAAGALILLDCLWKLGLGLPHLCTAASNLGSDVPFFLLGGHAVGLGRGDEVLPLPDRGALGVAVVLPDVQISTSQVYGRVRERLTWCRPEANVYSFAAGLDLRTRWEEMFNDLQEPVLEGWPIVRDAVRSVRETGPVRVGVSGSGGAVFGVYADRSEAERAGEILGSEWRTHVGVTLGRTEAEPVIHNLGEDQWK